MAWLVRALRGGRGNPAEPTTEAQGFARLGWARHCMSVDMEGPGVRLARPGAAGDMDRRGKAGRGYARRGVDHGSRRLGLAGHE